MKSWKPEGNILGVKGPMLFKIYFLSMFFHSYMELGDNELLGNKQSPTPTSLASPAKLNMQVSPSCCDVIKGLSQHHQPDMSLSSSVLARS